MRALQQLVGCPMPPPKTLDEIIRESNKLRMPFQHFATIIISQGDKNIIQGIGQSRPNNLILDQFGTWLAGLIRAPVLARTQITLQDITDTTRTVGMYDKEMQSNVFNQYTNYVLGTQLQVGAGVTAPTRADFNIETALGTAPEDALFDTGSGSYAGGAISFAGAITAGGAGTINEVGYFSKWRYTSAAGTFMLFHDKLVSGEAFVAVQTITVAYTINL